MTTTIQSGGANLRTLTKDGYDKIQTSASTVEADSEIDVVMNAQAGMAQGGTQSNVGGNAHNTYTSKTSSAFETAGRPPQ